MAKKQLTIFAIDDDAADLKILRSHLAKANAWEVEVVGFSRWQDARPELARRPVDVFLVDYLLGKETGLDVVREIRASGDERPIIVLTGQGDEVIAAEVTRAGANDYLVKQQLDSDRLCRAIENALTQFQLRQEKALLENELQQAQKMDTIGTLASGIAHDFNNILTAVMGCLDLALIKTHGQEVSKDLEQAQSACQRMAELVQRLLSFSRRGSSEKQPVNLVQVIREVEAILMYTLPKQVDLEIDVPDQALTLNANAAMLHQVLLNLCINGSDAIPDKGCLLISAKRIHLDEDFILRHPDATLGNNILLQVTDSGSGMDAETVNRVFEPFFTTKQLSPQRGTGLGLTVVWQNVRNHNGLITVNSEPGSGTTFQVYLPTDDCTEEAWQGEEAIGADIPQGNETILLVDDEPVIRDVSARMLELIGYKVIVAASGSDALDTYANPKVGINAVLMDISMPDMDGKECLKHLLKMDPDARVLLASGHDMTGEDETLTALGAKGVIQKPYSLGGLAQQLRFTLDV